MSDMAQLILDFTIAASLVGVAIWLCFRIPNRETYLGSNTE